MKKVIRLPMSRNIRLTDTKFLAVFVVSLFGFSHILQAQYLENFTGQNGKGLVDAICPAGTTNISNCGSICTANASDNTSTCTTIPPSFTGVTWSIVKGPAVTYFTDLSGFGFEFTSPDDFGVVSDRIQVDDPDQEICWLSPTLNISAAGAVSISVAVSQAGSLETGDFVRGEYSLNGGAFVQFGFQEGAFAATNLTVSGLTGSTLVIRVCAKTNGGGEQIYIDDVSVPQAGVTIYCPPPTCSVTGADYVCNNSPGNIYTAPPGMSTYNWGISGAGSIPGATNGQSVSVTSGNYLQNYTVSVTITDGNGCTSTCSKISNIFLFTPPANITVNPNPACFGATLNLSISAQASSTVSWSGEGITNPNGNPSTTAIPTSPGVKTYSVTVTTDAYNGGCSNTGSVNVTVNPLPPAPTCPSNSSTCLNTPAYALSGGSPGGGTYSGPGVSAGMFNPASAGAGVKTITYTVTDGNGCSNTCTFTITVNSPPSCSITFTNPPPWGQDTTCANSTGNIYSAPGGMSAYNWSISGSGSITSATNGSSVTVTAGNSGSYYLSVTITDANGCSSTCFDETPIKPSPTCSLSGPSSVACNSAGNVYSVSNGLFPISSYSWSISGNGTITSATTGSSVTVTSGGSGTYTVFVTSIGFNSCPSYCSQIVTIQACNLEFSGKIIFSNNNTLGVNNALVSLTGSANGSDLSDVNGDFSILSGVGSGSFTLTPTKTVNKLNGVTVADVTAIQQHVANSVPITDLYKQVAADVNKSNSINTTDATVVNQSLLGNPAALAQFKTSWRFAPTSHTMNNPPWGFPENRTYTNINASQTNQNFYGIKTGDIVTTFANPANFGAGNSLIFSAQDQILGEQKEVAVEFKVDQLADLAALQFALKFDVEKLELTEIIPLAGLPLAAENFGTYNLAEGEIRVVWSQATSVFLEEAAPVFLLKFKVLQGGGKLSEALQIDESEMPALSYTGALAESKVELKFSESTGTDAPTTAGLQLFQNRPNPFNGTTAIGFVLPENCEAQLRVFDVSGRMLAEKKAQYPAAGRNEETFDLEGVSGILYYELTTPFGILTKKMVALER